MARDIKFLKKDLEKLILTSVTQEMELLFAEHVRDTIYSRTKTGKGLTKNKSGFGKNELKPLNKLSPAYIKYRQSRVLGPYASAKKSNLTFSGELLESLVARISNKKGIVEIQKGKHWSGMDVRALAQKVSEQGRPFFGLSDTELKTFENFVKRTIRDNLRKKYK